MRSLRHIACTMLLGLSACVRVNVGEHLAAHGYASEPKRIFVVDALDSQFARNAADSFAAAVQEDLARCGVAAMVHRPDSMQLDAEANLRNALLRFRPDAMLNMRQSVRNTYNGDVRSGTYILTLHDLRQKRDVWKASMSLGSGASLFVDRSHAGADFAAGVVRQMAEDGVLRSCPSPTARPG